METMRLFARDAKSFGYEWCRLRWQHARLECAVFYHDAGAHVAAFRGDLFKWLTHLEYQALYHRKKAGLPHYSNERFLKDREEFCLLLELIKRIEPEKGPGLSCFNTKLVLLKATYGSLTRPLESRYGLGVAPNKDR